MCGTAGTLYQPAGEKVRCTLCKGKGYLHYCHGKRFTCSHIISVMDEYCHGCQYDRELGR